MLHAHEMGRPTLHLNLRRFRPSFCVNVMLFNFSFILDNRLGKGLEVSNVEEKTEEICLNSLGMCKDGILANQ